MLTLAGNGATLTYVGPMEIASHGKSNSVSAFEILHVIYEFAFCVYFSATRESRAGLLAHAAAFIYKFRRGRKNMLLVIVNYENISCHPLCVTALRKKTRNVRGERNDATKRGIERADYRLTICQL